MGVVEEGEGNECSREDESAGGEGDVVLFSVRAGPWPNPL